MGADQSGTRSTSPSLSRRFPSEHLDDDVTMAEVLAAFREVIDGAPVALAAACGRLSMAAGGAGFRKASATSGLRALQMKDVFAASKPSVPACRLGGEQPLGF